MPQPFNHAIMTNAGANLLLRAQFGEIKIEFTRMSVGNGVYEEEEKSLNSLQERTELKSEKNSYGLSDMHIHSEKSIKITALITNQDPVTGEALIEEGYYINEIGLFAREKGDNDSPEVLYSIAVTSGENGDFMPPYNGFNPAEIIQDYYVTVNNSAEVTIRSDSGAPALADDLQRLYRMVEQQNTDIQEKFLQYDEDLKGYTDAKIGQLINGAPETLDTLKEVADAIQENETVVEALNEAIGTKLNKDGDVRDTTVTFTSGDTENPEEWAEVAPVESGEKQSSLWRKVSLFAKNLRYLWKLCGTSDISGLADGTLTGAVSKLNTDLIVAKNWKYSTISFKACTGVTIEGGIEGFLDAKVIPKIEINPTSVNTFESIMGSTGGPSICALTFIYGAAYGAGIAFSYAGDTRLAQFYFNSGNYGIRFF